MQISSVAAAAAAKREKGEMDRGELGLEGEDCGLITETSEDFSEKRPRPRVDARRSHGCFKFSGASNSYRIQRWSVVMLFKEPDLDSVYIS
jgi:hypothetical protein